MEDKRVYGGPALGIAVGIMMLAILLTGVAGAAIETVNSISTSTNLIRNHGFEYGTISWTFFTNGKGTYNIASPGIEGKNASKISLSSAGTNIQLYQTGVTLEPNVRYRLSFAAYSTTGHDLTLNLIRHVSPYNNYGLVYTAGLGTGWKNFTTEFTTKGFTRTVNDGRFQFWLAPFAAAGDTYYIDDIRLEKVISTSPVPPAITRHPVNQTVNEGQTAEFSVVATGTAPLSYQWQKNSVNISGAVSPKYTTPATVLSDSGSNYRVLVTNSAGSIMSNAAALAVIPANSINLIMNSGFESGTTSWRFYTSGKGTFTAASPGYEGNNAAKLAFESHGTNVQLYQTGVTLEANIRYRLSFAAYSTTGHDMTVRLFKQVSPYTAYMPEFKVNLGTTWQTFTTEFTSSGAVNDGRLQFWFAAFMTAGDRYYIDNVRLEKVNTFSPPVISKQPSNQTVTAGQNATFTVVATGTLPLSYQWQKNGVNISGATSASYTASAITAADNNAQFRVRITNAYGSVLSISVSAQIAPDTKIFQHSIIDSANLGADLKAVGDLNGDGYPDVVVADNSGTPLQWYEWPSWTKHVIDTSSVFTTDMQLASIRGDGILDVIVPDFVNGQILWYENPRHTGGSPMDSWTKHIIGYSKAHDIEVGDVNRDGRVDVVVRPNFGRHILFLQDNPLSWERVDIATSTDGEGTALGDIDRDGYLDIVGNGYWLESPDDPANPNWIRHTINGSWPPLVSNKVADINKDGRLDVLIANSESPGRLAWYAAPANPGDAGATWVEHVIEPSVDYVHGILVADFDNDGDPDVAFSEMQQSARRRVGIYWNPGGGASWSLQVLATTGSHNIRMGDIDRDGDIDIVGANYKDTSPVELWRNMKENRPTLPLDRWFYIQLAGNHTPTFGLDFGDIDRDGKTDVVSGPSWYRNPGGKMTNSWAKSAVFPNGIHAILVVDVDGDNFTDVIGQKTEGTNLSIYWLEANDTKGSSFTARRVASLPAASHPQGSQGYRVAQIEKGGRPEILVSTRSSACRGIYYLRIPSSNPEAGNWPEVIVNSNPSDEGFGVADIDGDGNMDIAATTGETKRVEWYKNPGTGASTWQAFAVGDFSEAAFPDRLEVADLDGDGKSDIVATEENGLTGGAETFWWKQPANPMTSNWIRTRIISQGSTNNLGVADMDRDGDRDVILAEHKGTLNLSIWVNDGTGLFKERLVSSGKESHLGARTVDLDGDGDLDIVSIAWDAPQFIHLWRNDAI